MSLSRIYEFGGYRLEVPTRRLLRDGTPIPLPPKAFDVLVVLVERRDRVVEKTELMALVWADSFVEESNLTQTIFVLRKALNGDAGGNQFIETVPRRGYRFAAPVRAIAAAREESDPTTAAVARDLPIVETVAGPPHGSHRWRALRWIAGIVIVATAIAAAVTWPIDDPPTTGSVASEPTRLVVLPLQNLTADPTHEYFVDGLTDEIITQLSRLQPTRLAVIARTSAMTYKGTTKSAAEIGRELDADYIVEGSLRREGSHFRVNARLIRVRDQVHVWAEQYEREMRGMLALQREVADTIAGQMGIDVPDERRAQLAGSVVSAEAYEDYLKGRFFWNKMTVEGLRQSIDHFQAAVRREPAYAEAYSGLADSYASLGLWVPGADAFEKARNAADKAVTLRESLAEGHASRAFIAMSYEWDWDKAGREYSRALELNPGYAVAHHRYGYYLMLRGRWTEAEAELQKARDLDPLSMIINANIGFRLYMMRQYEDAISHWNKNLEMDPNFMLLYGYRGMAHVMKRMYPEALADFEKASSISAASAGTIGGVGYTYGVMGRPDAARKELARLLDMARREFVSAFYVAMLYTGLGDKDQAFAWLDRAYEERSGYLMEIHVDPMFDPLRSDPRFQVLTERLGHEPVRAATWGSQ